MSDELQVFRGDRPIEEVEQEQKPPAKPAKTKNSLPAGEPVGEAPAALVSPPEPVAVDTPADQTAAAQWMPEIEPGPVKVEIEPEPPYNFEIDPDSLWSMPEAMQERLSNLNATVAVIHQQLDDQERDTARIVKALRSLQ
ncbi:MAG: hypothetical protein ACKOAO_09965 [Oxalobacteraceae bacterium]